MKIVTIAADVRGKDFSELQCRRLGCPNSHKVGHGYEKRYALAAAAPSAPKDTKTGKRKAAAKGLSMVALRRRLRHPLFCRRDQFLRRMLTKKQLGELRDPTKRVEVEA